MAMHGHTFSRTVLAAERQPCGHQCQAFPAKPAEGQGLEKQPEKLSEVTKAGQ